MNEIDFVSYTEDNTSHVVGQSVDDVIDKLQNHGGKGVQIPSLISDFPILNFGSSPGKPLVNYNL